MLFTMLLCLGYHNLSDESTHRHVQLCRDVIVLVLVGLLSKIHCLPLKEHVYHNRYEEKKHAIQGQLLASGEWGKHFFLKPITMKPPQLNTLGQLMFFEVFCLNIYTRQCIILLNSAICIPFHNRNLNSGYIQVYNSCLILLRITVKCLSDLTDLSLRLSETTVKSLFGFVIKCSINKAVNE